MSNANSCPIKVQKKDFFTVLGGYLFMHLAILLLEIKSPFIKKTSRISLTI